MMRERHSEDLGASIRLFCLPKLLRSYFTWASKRQRCAPIEFVIWLQRQLRDSVWIACACNDAVARSAIRIASDVARQDTATANTFVLRVVCVNFDRCLTRDRWRFRIRCSSISSIVVRCALLPIRGGATRNVLHFCGCGTMSRFAVSPLYSRAKRAVGAWLHCDVRNQSRGC